MKNQACPLCFAEAIYMHVENPYGKLFTCHKCGDFFIDSSSEEHIKSLPEVTNTEFREKLSNMAKMKKPNSKFVIREPRDDERGGDGHGVARAQMIAQWVKS